MMGRNKMMQYRGIFICCTALFIAISQTATTLNYTTKNKSDTIIPCSAYYDTGNNMADEWNKTYGGRSTDIGYAVSGTADEGYVIVGCTYSFDIGGGDVWLIKTDSMGNELWNHTYGGRESDYGFCGHQTSDDGYIITGGTTSFGSGDDDVWLLKTDDRGNETWNKTFGGTEMDQGYSVKQTMDGGYIVVGGTKSFSFGPNDYWVIKTDESGNEMWNITYGFYGYDWGYDVIQVEDGGFVFTGATDTSLSGTHILDIGIVKLDTAGNVEWARVFNKPLALGRWDEAYELQQTHDGGFVIAGIAHTYSWSESGEGDAWVIKTDSQGFKEWDREFGGELCDCFSSVQLTDDGYVFCGWTYSYGQGKSDIFVVETDAEGRAHWERTFGGSYEDNAMLHTVQVASDGDYVVMGSTDSYGAGGTDVWLIKIAEPPISMELFGGFGLTASVKNIGDELFSSLRYSIATTGIIFFGGTSEGAITDFAPGSEILINVHIVGIGPVKAMITVGDVSKTAEFFMVGPFVMMR